MQTDGTAVEDDGAATAEATATTLTAATAAWTPTAAATAAAMRAREPLLNLDRAGTGKPRTTLEDPTFLDTFSKASRLAYIGSWRERWSALMEEHEAQSDLEIPRAPPVPPKGRGRVIFHVDLDCFFASVAVRSRPELRGKPVAVCWTAAETASTNSSSEISTANYEARKFGVKAGMWLGSAKKLCPNLVTVPFEFEEYSSTAEDVVRAALAVTPHLVGLSIDEFYADATAAVANEMTQGGDDEAAVHRVAAKLRASIFEATGCAASIGSAHNCLLARVATQLAKPDGHVHVSAGDGAEALAGLGCSALPHVGPKSAKALLGAGFETCADLAALGREKDVEAVVGPKVGKAVVRFARGVDDRKWEPRPSRKSVGAQCSWGLRCRDAAHAAELLAQLSQQVEEKARRLKCFDERQIKGVSVKVWRAKSLEDTWAKSGVGHGRCDHVSRSSPLPPRRPGDDDVGARVASAVRNAYKAAGVSPDYVRGLGVKLELLGQDDAEDSKITNFFAVASAEPSPPKRLAPRAQPEPRTKAARRGRCVVLVAVGMPGAGKSTFHADHLAVFGVERVCQDVLKSRDKCERAVANALAAGRHVYVDRTNIDAEQRAHWVRLAKASGAACVAVVFAARKDACLRRCAARRGHEGGLDARDPKKCSAVVGRFAMTMRAVAPREGFDDVVQVADGRGTEARADAVCRILKAVQDTHDADDADGTDTDADDAGDADDTHGASNTHGASDTHGARPAGDARPAPHRAAPPAARPAGRPPPASGSATQKSSHTLDRYFAPQASPRPPAPPPAAATPPRAAPPREERGDEPPRREDGPWTCTVCTYRHQDNQASFLCCALCESPKTV